MLYRKFLALLSAGLIFTFAALQWQCSSSNEAISYNTHIRPIFNQKCLSCHGGVKQSGDFGLLFEEDAYGETKSGKVAIVKGNHQKSELFKRIIHDDPEHRMPYKADPLNEEEIQLITKWIDQGAKWEEHWAYLLPEKREPPKIDDPWIRNDIDPFVLRKMRELEMEPEEEASKEVLIRRLSFDLTGLPPSMVDVESFLSDESPDAYEKAVDRLLASPHFGERWAAMWLDLARYADSKGYEKDPYRSIWRYRDWVIDAFNQDMPFDQFTIEQLAGDMLEHPDKDQLLATAFHRNSMTNTEGGTDDEEFRVAAVIDRLNTTYEVWQGTTMGCVQCHSHPYDPIRHEEFYQSYDFLNQTQDGDLDTDVPRLSEYSKENKQKIKEIIRFISSQSGDHEIDTSALLTEQIRQSVFPQLIPIQADDFENVSFRGDGGVSNWVYNLLAMKGRHFRFKFDDIPMDKLKAITFNYNSQGSDAKVEVRLGAKDGKLIGEHQFRKTNANRWATDGKLKASMPVQEASGRHTLYFEIINTTGKIPEGMITIHQIKLEYDDAKLKSKTLTKAQEELQKLRTKEVVYTPILKPKSPEMKRQTKLFERGNWNVQTTDLSAKAPGVLLYNGQNPSNRLEFAQWLASEDNPLTSRVIVNRFWEQIFGRGLVETLEDFGTQSDPPSHPELLDHLAVSFMQDHNWSVKQLVKQMVMSATYRQSSKLSPEKKEKDPYNVWLARGTRFRLSAEQIRDQALAVSDLLYDTVGGKSVMPPQPDGVWQIVYSGEKWESPQNKLRFRRGLYTLWKRTAPYPSMVAFDSPSREFCVSRRIRTNTPLQALVTLNDPAFLEAAEALGKKMEEAGGGNLEESLKYGYKKALAKDLDPQSLEVLEGLYRQAKASLVKDPPNRNIKVLNQEEEDGFELKDPMTVVANAIMNLDSFLTKE